MTWTAHELWRSGSGWARFPNREPQHEHHLPLEDPPGGLDPPSGGLGRAVRRFGRAVRRFGRAAGRFGRAVRRFGSSRQALWSRRQVVWVDPSGGLVAPSGGLGRPVRGLGRAVRRFERAVRRHRRATRCLRACATRAMRAPALVERRTITGARLALCGYCRAASMEPLPNRRGNPRSRFATFLTPCFNGAPSE